MTYFFASFIPSIALQVRRLRDAGFHWALIFLRFASFIGDIVLLVLCCQPTKSRIFLSTILIIFSNDSYLTASLGCFLVDLPEDWSFGIVEVSKNEEILL